MKQLLKYIFKYYTLSFLRLGIAVVIGAVLYILFWYIPEAQLDFERVLHKKLLLLENANSKIMFDQTRDAAFCILLIAFFDLEKYVKDTVTMIAYMSFICISSMLIMMIPIISIILEMQFASIYDNIFFILVAKSIVMGLILIGNWIVIATFMSIVVPPKLQKKLFPKKMDLSEG